MLSRSILGHRLCCFLEAEGCSRPLCLSFRFRDAGRSLEHPESRGGIIPAVDPDSGRVFLRKVHHHRSSQTRRSCAVQRSRSPFRGGQAGQRGASVSNEAQGIYFISIYFILFSLILLLFCRPQAGASTAPSLSRKRLLVPAFASSTAGGSRALAVDSTAARAARFCSPRPPSSRLCPLSKVGLTSPPTVRFSFYFYDSLIFIYFTLFSHPQSSRGRAVGRSRGPAIAALSPYRRASRRRQHPSRHCCRQPAISNPPRANHRTLVARQRLFLQMASRVGSQRPHRLSRSYRHHREKHRSLPLDGPVFQQASAIYFDSSSCGRLLDCRYRLGLLLSEGPACCWSFEI